MRESSRTYLAPKAKSRKKSVNLSIDGDLLRQAKASGINLSRFVEEHLAAEMKRRREIAWLAENREAIEAYNRYAEKHGVFSDGLRRF